MSDRVTINVPYTPNEKQCLFHACGADEVVYGGAKGGGKSCALVMEALAYGLEHPGATMYLFRETYKDLEEVLIREWKNRVPQELYTYNGTKHTATLVNGTVIYFRFVRTKSDAESYDGRSMDWLGIDELTRHEESTVQILLSCVRSAKGFPPRFRGSCNPGGPGHRFVKSRYIDPTNKGKKQYKDPVTGNTIAFIPATVYDNTALMESDPSYARRLENLPPKKRAAYLHGDWDQYDGQAFEEFEPDIHVVEPFEIPDHWPGWLAVDNGHSDPFAWYWFRVDERGIVYIVREFTRDYGDLKLTYSQQAKRVLELSTYTKMGEGGQLFEYQEPIVPVYCGHEAFASHPLAPDGKTIAWCYQQGGLVGVQPIIPDKRLRKAIWHEYLKPIELPEPDPHTGRSVIAKVQIFKNCERLIETLPMQMEDENDPEKVAESNFDHWYDGAGFGLVAWHVNRSRHVELPKKQLPFPLRSNDEDREVDALQEYLWS